MVRGPEGGCWPDLRVVQVFGVLLLCSPAVVLFRLGQKSLVVQSAAHELSFVSVDQECPDPVLAWNLPSADPGLSLCLWGNF